jgi:hypothetical protein
MTIRCLPKLPVSSFAIVYFERSSTSMLAKKKPKLLLGQTTLSFGGGRGVAEIESPAEQPESSSPSTCTSQTLKIEFYFQ